MPKMKLLQNTSEDEPLQRLPRAVCAPTSSHGPGQLPLNKETVFEWFGLHLDPVRRLEFMCGLLHMCQPLELRFLGSYLEDLARKDYHILRDFECRANSPIELGNLTDVNDPVVRSKLLVCLSLLGSDSRECAGILFQTLSRVDPNQLPQTSLPCPAPPPRLSVRCQGGEAPVDGSSEQNQAAVAVLEQLALLFTMASLHPAFHFHQRQMLRAQLDKTQLTVEEEQRQSVLRRTAQALELQSLGEHCVPSSKVSSQNEAVHIERIVLRGISRTKGDREYNFKVTWSDSSSSRVTKTHSELENFLLKLPKHQCNESFEKGLLQLLKQVENKSTEEQLRNHLLSAPPVFTQSRKVCCFFTSDSGPSSDARQAYHEPASDGSSQDEESYVQGYNKKHRNRSPSLTCHVESQVTEHDKCENRNHAQPALRGKGKTKGTPNGSLAATFQWKEAVSGPDTLGESSSERSSCASSPQHRATDSLDSEEEQHCAAWKQAPAYPGSHSAEGLGADPLLPMSLQTHMEAIRADNPDVGALSFMPYPLPPGAPPLSKPGPGAVRMHLPPAMAGPGFMVEPDKGDHITTFGVSPITLPPPEISAMQPLVQRFKSLCHAVGDAPSSAPPTPLPTPIRAISVMSTSLPSLSASLQPSLPCPDSAPMGSVPLVETPHTKLPALNLPYSLPPTPTSVMTSVEAAVAAAPPVQGLLQAAVPPVVPTHTPGPAPSPSPALTPSMAHSDCTSSSPSSEVCVEGPGQRPQPPLSCGMCGCQCGGRPVSASPMFFHQVGAGARPLLGMPHLFPLTNYLPQAHAAPQPQPNGTTLPPIYAPYGPLHSHTDLLGLQQQMPASFCQRLYPTPQHYASPVSRLPPATLGGGLNKKNGSVSCSNCGMSGHYTHDCNQPSIDSTQQGGFRLKYAASHISEAPDKAEGAV
ncbi:zinc finger CCHC domain-containing protein 2 [Boleophthalmus pectinirostris]|uniref:zinc finger CCHC domain-containing protein 2 n=1 Tax=Boleophthalmus pectinirostris TaxID=150288 RepID=UPI00242F9B63|nr:zinc finger CCHC domain-containing protein 2 [Boleophthalmus pectinirostris]